MYIEVESEEKRRKKFPHTFETCLSLLSYRHAGGGKGERLGQIDVAHTAIADAFKRLLTRLPHGH